MSPIARFPEGTLLRPGRPEDAAALQEIERDADTRFAGLLGPEWEPNWAPSDKDELRAAALAGQLFLVAGPDEKPCGYLWMEALAEAGHIAEMAVTQAAGRNGLGRLLIATAEAWAERQGFAALILTTFRDVPWNAPFYARCGFREIEAKGALAEVLAEERARFAAPRCAMRKTLRD